MKRRLSILFVLAAMLATFTSTVFAASGKSVTLASVDYQKGGVTLTFETSGLTKADLNDNSFYANSNFQDMYCKFVDGTTTVRCTVSKALAGLGGFHVILAGFQFWGELPQEKGFGFECDAGQEPWYTLNIYDNGEFVDSVEIPVQVWEFFVAQGFLEFLEEMGVTVQITGTFCGPGIESFEPV